MSNRILFSGAFAAAFTFAAFAVSTAHAADLGGPYYGSSDEKTEFGSGWYIRGDLGATEQQRIGVADVPSFDTTDAVANPQAPSPLSASSNRLGYDASLGAGYQFNRWFRADLTANFVEPSKSTATRDYSNCFNEVNNTVGTEQCYANLNSSLHEYAVLANAYVDLGTWYGVTPYVGAGAGLSFGSFSASSVWWQANQTPFTRTYTCGSSTCSIDWDRTTTKTYYNLAWALMGGVAIDIYDHTKLDLGYRYLNLGTINTGSGSVKLSEQEIRAGLRYMIDN